MRTITAEEARDGACLPWIEELVVYRGFAGILYEKITGAKPTHGCLNISMAVGNILYRKYGVNLVPLTGTFHVRIEPPCEKPLYLTFDSEDGKNITDKKFEDHQAEFHVWLAIQAWKDKDGKWVRAPKNNPLVIDLCTPYHRDAAASHGKLVWTREDELPTIAAGLYTDYEHWSRIGVFMIVSNPATHILHKHVEGSREFWEHLANATSISQTVGRSIL